MNSLLAALSFLTVLPFGKSREYTPEQIVSSMIYYPLVGIILAGLCSVIYFLVSLFLPHPVACMLVLAGMSVFTGCLHLDGFADTCDGLAGGEDKDRILAIMKDSYVGPAGVVGLFILLLGKFSVLASLGPKDLPLALILSLGLSRWSLVAACWLWPYARSESGTGSVFAGQVDKRHLIRATLIAVVISLFICGWQTVTLWAGLLTCFWVFNVYISKKIGGLTGDTLGALNEICELVVLLLSLAFVF